MHILIRTIFFIKCIERCAQFIKFFFLYFNALNVVHILLRVILLFECIEHKAHFNTDYTFVLMH